MPRRGTGQEAGVVALEFALLVPVVALLLFAVILAGVHAADHVVVQDAARLAARAASTSRDDPRTVQQVVQAVGDRAIAVALQPQARRPGDLVTATVTFTRNVGVTSWTVVGTATAATEPDP